MQRTRNRGLTKVLLMIGLWSLPVRSYVKLKDLKYVVGFSQANNRPCPSRPRFPKTLQPLKLS
jgi:hypothetical protein